MVSAHASDTAPDPPGRETDHPERIQWPTDPQDGGFRNSVSCRTSFGWQITVQLAEQGIAVLLGPVSEVSNEGLDLLAGGFAQCLCPAELHRIGLHQVGIKLVLPDDLAQTIANLGPTVVSVRWLRRELA